MAHGEIHGVGSAHTRTTSLHPMVSTVSHLPLERIRIEAVVVIWIVVVEQRRIVKRRSESEFVRPKAIPLLVAVGTQINVIVSLRRQVSKGTCRCARDFKRSGFIRIEVTI